MRESRRILRFTLVGVIGFLVDAATLYLLALQVNPYLARLCSFLAAVVVTWRLNATLTFGSEGRGFVAYVSGQSLGLALNYLVYSAVLWVIRGVQGDLLIALAAGSGCAMVFNYVAMKYWIFSEPRN